MPVPISINQLLAETDLNTFLVDASGVLYNEAGPIPTAADTIKRFQDLGPTILVTNNSYMNPVLIQEHLASQGIRLDIQDIFSSGYGLSMDNTLAEQIKDRDVYVFGHPHSYPYVESAKPKRLCDHPDQAEVIILTSSNSHVENEADVQNIVAAKQNQPDLPIICSNPDLFIAGGGGSLIKVIGSYGIEIEDKLGNPISWFGKPYENFSLTLGAWLEDIHGIKPGQHCAFFDDNINNIRAMQHHLGITGCLITDTGLFPQHNPKHLPGQSSIEPTRLVSSL